MARLIDADKLDWWYKGRPIRRVIDEAPTVDAVPVVHGRWIEAEDGDGAVCSVCGEDFCNVYLEVERFLYCPNCGAKTDLEEDNG